MVLRATFPWGLRQELSEALTEQHELLDRIDRSELLLELGRARERQDGPRIRCLQRRGSSEGIAMSSSTSDTEFARIVYRDFYDVPRVLIVMIGRKRLLLESVFDEKADDYSESYQVYRLEDDFEPPVGSWEMLAGQAIGHIGAIPVRAVEFDSTLRQSIRLTTLQSFVSNV
jgi:hypothetical protein